MITKIGTVAIYVEDQQKAQKFWVEVMGFKVENIKDMGNEMSWLEVAPPNAETCLVIYPKAIMPDYTNRKPSMVFHCNEIEAFYETLKTKGVHFTMELTNLPWGKFASFLDEDGNEFGLKEA